MKTMVLCAVFLVLTVQLAVAQEGFSLFTLETSDYCEGPPSDPYQFCNCTILSTTGPVTVYVFHRVREGTVFSTRKIRFRVVADAELLWTYVGETIPVDDNLIRGYTGNTQDGIEIDCAYGGGNRLLAIIEYTASAYPPGCTGLRARPHPNSTTGSVEFEGSDGVWRVPTYVLDLLAYPCGGWCLVPTKTSTWGAIKALYQ